MTDLFYTGGPLFMGLLTLILTAIITASIFFIINQKSDNEYTHNKLSLIKELSILALVIGVLGQFLGLYSAFSIIEQSVEISPELLARGLKVSSIPAIYGFIICVLGYLTQIGLRLLSRNSVS